MLDVIQSSIGRWHQILPVFGIESRYLTGRHVDECPLCGVGTNRFRWDNKGGSGTYICSQCGAGDGMRLLMKHTGKDFKELADEVREVIGETNEVKIPEEKTKDLKKIKDSLIKIYKESVRSKKHLYLRSRGINSNPDVIYHKAMTYYEDGRNMGTFPALIGLIKSKEGKAIGMQRIYLDSFGKEKAKVSTPKKITPLLTDDCSGCAIRLYEITGDVLGIAEGIETACAAHDLFDVPVWSVVSTAIMEKFEPPEGINGLIIYGDNDKNYSGQKAAYALAKRMTAKGLSVSVKIPEIKGSDFNDVLMRNLGIEVKQT